MVVYDNEVVSCVVMQASFWETESSYNQDGVTQNSLIEILLVIC